jgi:hypothetical protein
MMMTARPAGGPADGCGSVTTSASLRGLTGGVTAVHAMISAYPGLTARQHAPVHPRASPTGERARATPSDRRVSRWQQDRLRCLLGARALSTPNPVWPGCSTDAVPTAATYPGSRQCQPRTLACRATHGEDLTTVGLSQGSGHRASDIRSRGYACLSARLCPLCPAPGKLFSCGRGKICRRCPLACDAFGVWITPLGVT